MRNLGEIAYRAYAASMNRQNTAVDDWDDIGEVDQRAWEDAANAVIQLSLGDDEEDDREEEMK